LIGADVLWCSTSAPIKGSPVVPACWGVEFDALRDAPRFKNAEEKRNEICFFFGGKVLCTLLTVGACPINHHTHCNRPSMPLCSASRLS